MGRVTRSNSTRGIGTSTIHYWTLQIDSFIVRVSCTKSSFILQHLAEDVFPEGVSRSYISCQQWTNFQPRDRHYSESVFSITYVEWIYIYIYIYIVTKSSQNSLNVFPFLFDESVTQDGNQSIQGAPKCRSKVSSFREKPTRDSILRIKTNVTFSSIFFLLRSLARTLNVYIFFQSLRIYLVFSTIFLKILFNFLNMSLI